MKLCMLGLHRWPKLAIAPVRCVHCSKQKGALGPLRRLHVRLDVWPYWPFVPPLFFGVATATAFTLRGIVWYLTAFCSLGIAATLFLARVADDTKKQGEQRHAERARRKGEGDIHGTKVHPRE